MMTGVQVNVTHRMRPRQLANKTLAAIDDGDVVWLSRTSGRRNALATMESAATIVAAERPDAQRVLQLREGTDATVVWSVHPAEFTDISYFITSRPERYRLRELEDGELEAYRVDGSG